MAEESEGALKTVPLAGGMYRPVPETAVPERGVTGYVWDKALGVGQGAIDLMATPAAVGRDVTGDKDYQAAAQTVQEIAADTKRKLGGWKTSYGQAQEEGKVAPDTSVVGTLLDSLPATAAIIASGPLAPVTGGAIAHGVMGTEMWDRLRRMPQEEIEKFPKYQELRGQGLSDADARQQMYSDRNTMESLLLNVGSNAVFAGIAQKVVAPFAPGLRGEAQTMTRSVIKNAMFGAGEGAVAGAALGGGSEAGRQAGEIGAGLRDKYDWDRISEATIPTAENLALLGGVAGAGKGFLPAAKVRPGVEKSVEKTGAVAENTGYTPTPDEIGTDLMVVAGENLGGTRPRPRGSVTDVPDTTAKPPGVGTSPLPAEPAAARAPGAPVSPSPVAPVAPGVRAAAPTAPVEPRPVEAGRPAEGVPPQPVVPAEVRALPPPEAKPAPPAAPVAEAKPAEPVAPAKQPMSVEELKAEMRDMGRTPAYGDLAKLIKRWQDDNPDQKLTDRNSILQEHKTLRTAAAEQLKATKAQAVAAARAAKTAEAAATAAAKTPAEPTPAPAAAPAPARAVPPKISEEIQQRVAERKAALAAEVKPAEEVTQPGKPVPIEPKAPPKAVTTGAKAVEAITQAAEAKKTRTAKAADLVALKTTKTQEKAAVTEVESDKRGERREVEKTKREQAARQIFESHADDMATVEGLQEKIKTGRPSALKDDLAKVGETVAKMVNTYKGKLSELSNQNPKHPTYTLGRFGESRAGKGDHHAVMSDLNNLGRGITNALAKGEGMVAKARALDAINRIKQVKEGRLEEIATERKATNEAITMQRKTVHLGDDIDKVRSVTDEQSPLSWGKALRKIGVVTREEHLRENFVDGVEHKANLERQGHLVEAAERKKARTGKPLDSDEFKTLLKLNGEKMQQTTLGELMSPDKRPANPISGAIYDAVRSMVKDTPATIWSRDAMDAWGIQRGFDQGPRAFHASTGHGETFFRPDTAVPRTIFHEAIHAATARAMRTSPRLEHLVSRLQDMIEGHGGFLTETTDAAQYAIRREGKRVNPYEFMSELYSREDVRAMVERVELTPDEIRELTEAGYRVDKGKSLLRTLWENLLETLGFKAKTPNAYKVAVDILQDTFEREHELQARDSALGRELGGFYNTRDLANLRAQDPVLGGRAADAIARGDDAEAASHLMDMAHKMDAETSDKAIDYLSEVNKKYYGHSLYDAETGVTRLSSPEEVRGGVEKFLGDRLGTKAADYGYQMDKLFATPMRHFVQGLRYTNDLGNNLEQGFRKAIQPLKDSWSRREHFAQEYMDKSGANKLIDDLATLKHAIKDRGLWNDFEQLLIRESYTRAFADEELGIGRNAHIDTGSLRDAQTVADHKANQAAFAKLMERDPSGRLRDMRNRIHDFEARDLEVRKRAQASDMLHRMGIVEHGDGVALSALLKDVRNQASTMTDAERKAFARVTGPDHESKQFRDYMADRKVIRGMLDQTEAKGPHVPFMRHGNHVLSAKYVVRPDAGVKYVEMNPGADIHKGYDFADEADARTFVKNVLSREDIQITQTGGSEVVYDTRTGERAKNFTVEKQDGTARTYDNRHDAEQARQEGDTIKEKNVRADEIAEMKDNNLPTAHYQIYHRVEFNPQEYLRFESERAADEYRNRINHDAHDPNFEIQVANVETPRDIANRGVADHASSEMTQWVNRVEASPAYQKMSPEMQEEWKRELRNEAARVTMMTGRRSMFLPREYAKGASTDILKNMIQSSGASARAIAGNVFNPKIADAREQAQKYVDTYRNQSGGFGKDHRARQDILDEFDRRLHAPVKVEGSWAQGIKRALQVSMISHLADAGYLVINAMEPWVLGAAISASRHGWGASYAELARATALVNPMRMAKEAGAEIAAAAKGKYRPAQYESILLDGVKGQADAEGLTGMLRHMFSRGLAARDSGMEVERIHDPSSNIIGRGLDRLDGTFRGANTGVETQNRASIAIMNYRLEMRKGLKEGLSHEVANEAAIRYAEDQVFKGAGDYGSWNNPRYFSNPVMKLAGQFKKYPLRIASVYADAIIQAFRGDRQAQKQVAYMLATQGLVTGLAGLPTGPFAGTVNAAYILGLTDSNWDDVMFGLRKGMVDHGMSTQLADGAMHGVLDFTGASFSPKLSQSSMIFQGSADTRNLTTLAGRLGVTALGAPGDMAKKYVGGIQQIGQAVASYRAGSHSEATQHGIQAADGILQLKFVHDIAKAFQLMTVGPTGMPKGNEGHTGQAISQVLGFTPTEVARKYEAKGQIKRAQQQETAAHSGWVNKWIGASNTTEQSAIWANIQKNYNPTVPPEQRISYADLWKAKTRQGQTQKKDQTKLGVNLSGRQRSFADIGHYFNVGN